MVDWQASLEPIPYSHVATHVIANGRSLDLEILLTPREDGANFKKQVRINGVNRQAPWTLWGSSAPCSSCPRTSALWMVRRVTAAATSTLPSARWTTPIAALSQYQKVVEQRNSLLRMLHEREAPTPVSNEDQLGFWDRHRSRWAAR